MIGIGRRAAALLLLAAVGGCGPGSEPKERQEPPAEVRNPVAEADLTTLRLTPEAKTRIGIEVGEVESKHLTPTRTLGGELLVAPGSSATVTAPKAAVVLDPEGGSIPGAGSYVRQGEALLRLVVLPAEGSLAGAREEVAVAEARLANARTTAERASQLLQEGVGTAQAHEDAQELLKAAEAVLATTRAQLQVLLTGHADPGDPALSPLTLTAPDSGVVRQVLVAAGQTVSGSDALLEIVDARQLWARVPVYVGDLSGIDRRARARVSEPGGSGGSGIDATPLPPVPVADASSASADLFYLVPNPDGLLRPGQRVSVTLPLLGAAARIVVPWSSVVHDVHGGTWVYEVVAPQTYVRRRVEVSDVIEDEAVLERGPEPGTKVVVVGVAELFSTEFGPSH